MKEGRVVVLTLSILRRMTGLTQEEMAERLMVSQASLSQWESGTYAIPDNQVEEILKVLRPRLRKLSSYTPVQAHIIRNLKATDLSKPWDTLLVDAAIALQGEAS